MSGVDNIDVPEALGVLGRSPGLPTGVEALSDDESGCCAFCGGDLAVLVSTLRHPETGTSFCDTTCAQRWAERAGIATR